MNCFVLLQGWQI